MSFRPSGGGNKYVEFSDYIYYYGYTTTNIQDLLLTILRYSGQFGNNIFFVCSAWFLLESKRNWGKKILRMMADVWVVSVLFLIGALLIKGQEDPHLILVSLLPTTFGNNWYLTCYILFYAMHPYLNRFLEQLSQRELLRWCICLTGLYSIMNFIFEGVFFLSSVTMWITIYFDIAYMKRYLPALCDNKRINTWLALGGAVGGVAVIVLTDLWGLTIGTPGTEVLRWNTQGNPFMIVSAFGLLQWARCSTLRWGKRISRFVCEISSLSLLTYIFHENILFRTYFRPYVWQWIYLNYGYKFVLLWAMGYVVVLFAAAVIVAYLYKILTKKPLEKLSDRLLIWVNKGYAAMEQAIMRLSHD